MDVDIKRSNGQLNVTFSGKFVFSDNAKFKKVLDAIEENPPQSVVIIMSALEYVDSAALGMLLLLKDTAKNHNATVVLQSPSGQVDKLLRMSRFDQVFPIRY